MIVRDELRRLATQRFHDKRKRPIWLQIYDRLAEAMEAGILSEGAKLPGEDDLAELFGVTRVTLRRALDRHQQEGRLLARKGVGVFVRSIAVRYVVHQHDAFNDPLNAEEIRLQTLSLTRKPASAAAAEAFGLKPGSEVIELRTLHLQNSAPIYLAVKEFPPLVFPAFERAYEETGTILGVYAVAGIERYVRAETRVFGDFANAQEADLLKLSPGAPLIRSRSINKDLGGRIIELNRGCWPMFSVELVFGSLRDCGPTPGYSVT